MFITFEGPEGCGKSTHSRLLCDYLTERGFDCVYTREPGGTALGDYVRRILLHSKATRITDIAEVFLFEAARAQIVNEIILPALKNKRIVICDRFYDATSAYQGYGGGVSLANIRQLNRLAAGGLKPDLTILLDVDTVTGLRRAKRKGADRMEAKDVAYHRRVRAGYLKLAEKEPQRIKIVKVEKDLDKTQEKIRKIAGRHVIQRYQGPR
ncbi:MAG: dTMP kinase [Candidatus Omnitrophica bacterium]|nr:dTMP kinase [Candidatus Omnitrophota bacterium]